MLHIPETLGLVLDRRTGAGEPDDFLGERLHGHRVPITDVVRPGDGGGRGGEGEGADDILHVDEIARLLPVAEDADRFAAHGLLDEDRDGGGVGGLRVLAGTEDIEETERGGRQAVFASEQLEVVLPVQFRHRVRRLRFGEHRLDLRDRRVVAIDGGGGSQDDLADLRGGGGFEHVEGAGGVQLDALARPEHGFRDRDHGGQVEHLVDPAQGLVELGTVEDRAFDQAVLKADEVAAMTAAEVVEDDDLGAALEMLDDVGADEAGAAGDEDAHGQRTSACMAENWASMDSTSLNWVRRRSRLWRGRLILK